MAKTSSRAYPEPPQVVFQVLVVGLRQTGLRVTVVNLPPPGRRRAAAGPPPGRRRAAAGPPPGAPPAGG